MGVGGCLGGVVVCYIGIIHVKTAWKDNLNIDCK